MRGRDFRWDATLMGSFNRNKVLSLTGGQDVITSGIRVIEVGRPIYEKVGFVDTACPSMRLSLR